MPRQNILGFSFFPAYLPPDNGGVERLFNVYHTFARNHDVTLISSAQLGGEREVVQHAPSFREIRVPKDEHFARCYADLAPHQGSGDLSGPALGLAARQYGALHDEYLAAYVDADVIIHDSPFTVECDLFRGFDDKLRIYHSYNCETSLYRSFHNLSDQDVIGKLVEALERDVCAIADLVTACSAADAAELTQRFRPRDTVILFPNGFVPIVHGSRDARPRGTPIAAFIGSAHEPNLQAVKAITQDIAPQLPDVEFHLIGSCAPEGRHGNVIAHGVVGQERKTELLRSATLAINPMTSGSGSSLKVADIASHQLPLVSTDLGVRGFDLEVDRHYLPLNMADPAATIRNALRDPQRLASMAHTAKAHFETTFSWATLVADFEAAMEDAISRKSVIRPRLVLNDYDSTAATGGGATRTRGLCEGLSETAPIIFLALAEDETTKRQVLSDGKILSITIGKSDAHRLEQDEDQVRFHVSSADIVNYRHAEANLRLLELFRCAASASSVVICEHPYMVGLPRKFAVDFVYSSQNFELGMKRQTLSGHPRAEGLLDSVREAEAYACGASSFILAVSDQDAEDLGATYQVTSPILLVPNGAEGPVTYQARPAANPALAAPSAVFMGSSHGPNVIAAQWIAEHLAPAMPKVTFLIVGSVGDALSETIPANVRIAGQLSAEEKSRLLDGATVALNPMAIGSGSNVKVADYLQHGLPVVSTVFGARGYEWVPAEDIASVELEDFAGATTAMLGSNASTIEAKERRRLAYRDKLSMRSGGRAFAELLEAHAGDRPRAFYVTYRYHEPALGGGESYVVRLVQALARDGWRVDVASPDVLRIQDVGRFAAVFSNDANHPIPFNSPRISSIKFPVGDLARDPERLRNIWLAQPDFEKALFNQQPRPCSSSLAWGWSEREQGGRWCFQSAGIYLSKPAKLRLVARGVGSVWLRLSTGDGKRLIEQRAQHLSFECLVPAGVVELQCSVDSNQTDDPRPLAMFVYKLELDGVSIIDGPARPSASKGATASEAMRSLSKARRSARDPRRLSLCDQRNPSAAMNDFVSRSVSEYDLLITHNAVFGSTAHAIRAAHAAGVPSIVIPHLHLDDDFYQFQDVLESSRLATKALVSPRAAVDILREEGLANVVYHSPGIDTSADFTADDARKFRTLLGAESPFFLVLGRKALAKGYRDILDAAASITSPSRPLIVMIGPDDDGLDLSQGIYLGRQPDDIVRGALRECRGLINMSQSESFGIVLLEAGLAGKPVLGNRSCAAFADLIVDDRNGYLVTNEDLPVRLTQLWNDPDLCERLGKAGRTMALEHDWQKAERAFVTICNEVGGPSPLKREYSQAEPLPGSVAAGQPR